MLCTPTVRSDLEKEPPLPMAPSRSEVHDRLAVRSPSSASTAVPLKVMISPASNVAPSVGVLMDTVGAVLAVAGMYSTCSKGAPDSSPSYASAVRSPLPVIIIASELPLDHPERSMISCMIEDISGVCWSGPASPTVVHGTGAHSTADNVLDLSDMLPLEEVKVGALSMSSPSIVREVTSELISSTWNCR